MKFQKLVLLTVLLFPAAGAGAVGVRSYTAFGELAEQRVVRDAGPGRVGLAEVFRRSYAHDESGRITAIDDSRWARGPSGPEAATLVFGHDVDGRLASSVLPDRGLAAYEADAAGNVPAARSGCRNCPWPTPAHPTTVTASAW
ncbi:hypothetical protein [Rubrivirga sp.]|uniref:hypothetical protein n=1 Tax=Rubrivirga sp. TaxID=1885344 RepID=UPI003B525E23